MILATNVLAVSLLLIAPLTSGDVEVDNSHHHSLEVEAAATAESEEHLTERHLNLDDPAEWSASTEVLDEFHAWYRRRRSLDVPQKNTKTLNNLYEEKTITRAPEEEQLTLNVKNDDMELAESAVFMPSFLRLKKKVAHDECRIRNQEFNIWKRYHPYSSHQTRSLCNQYCCYSVTPDT